MANELKPCPFCGGKAEVRFMCRRPYIMCVKCHAQTACYNIYKKAKEAWNKRVAGQQLDNVTCQDCGTVFYGSPNRHFCNNCLKRRQSERAKAMNLNKIGVAAHVANTTGRRAEDGK